MENVKLFLWWEYHEIECLQRLALKPQARVKTMIYMYIHVHVHVFNTGVQLIR